MGPSLIGTKLSYPRFYLPLFVRNPSSQFHSHRPPMPPRKKRNFKNLTLESSPVVVSANGDSSDNRRASVKRLEEEYSKLCEQLSDLEIGLELRLDLRPEDFQTLDELGRGNGGTVCKVLHVRTNTVMARKVKVLRVLLAKTVSDNTMETKKDHSCGSEYQCPETNYA